MGQNPHITSTLTSILSSVKGFPVSISAYRANDLSASNLNTESAIFFQTEYLEKVNVRASILLLQFKNKYVAILSTNK